MKEIEIQTHNLRFGALSSGNVSGTPVIALHGWLDNAASFIPIAEHLTEIQLIALDLPGHGKSEHRRGANAYHFVDYATDIIQVADALELDRFTLLGHSLGAGISALVAATVPSRVSKLAMIEGLIPLTNNPDKFLQQFRRHVEQVTPAPSEARVYATIEAAASARHQAGDIPLSGAKLIAERNLRAVDTGYTWRSDRRLSKASPLYLTETHVKHYLKSIECESMLIRSDQGILANWPSLRGRESYLKYLSVIDIKAGHHCHMEKPEEIAQLLHHFLTNGA